MGRWVSASARADDFIGATTKTSIWADAALIGRANDVPTYVGAPMDGERANVGTVWGSGAHVLGSSGGGRLALQLHHNLRAPAMFSPL